jgi:hypothetical protein
MAMRPYAPAERTQEVKAAGATCRAEEKVSGTFFPSPFPVNKKHSECRMA